MSTLSVVISAWNEEKKIGRCLESVPFADEIIVVDNTSTDNTVKIAKKFTPHVYIQPNKLMLNINKNYGFGKAKSEWILNLDADEEITAELAKEIKEVIKNPGTISGYWIPRKNIIFGKWIQHGIWWPDKQLRLFKRNSGKFNCTRIHEYISVQGNTADLKEPYIHHNYETISQYLKKLDRCTTSEAEELLTTDYQLLWSDALRFPLSDFIKIYFAQAGYQDGLHGLILALLQSFYSFVVFTKVWENHKFIERDIPIETVESEINYSNRDIRYWLFQTKIVESASPLRKLWLKMLRKFNL